MNKRGSKIVLFNPLTGPDWSYEYQQRYSHLNVPMGLLNIGQFLIASGYSVQVIDACADEHWETKLSELDDEVLFCGITAMTVQIPHALKISEEIREKCTNTPVVWGGIHPTLFPEQTCQDPLIDVVVYGEGEQTCLELARTFECSGPLQEVRGIAYYERTKRQVIKTPRRDFEQINIEEMSTPDFSAMGLDVENYITRSTNRKVGHVRMITILTGLGCPYRCSFCINTFLHPEQSGYRGKSADKILDEVQNVIQKYNVNSIRFRDENFFVQRPRFFSLLEGIEQRKLSFSWYVNARVDHFAGQYLSEAVVKRLSDSGLVGIGVGVESGSEKVLAILRKDITLEDVECTSAICKKYGIYIDYSFMIGIPGETKDDMLATFRLIRHLQKRYLGMMEGGSINGPQIYRPYPGADLYIEAVAQGLSEPVSVREWAIAAAASASDYLDIERMPWIKMKEKKTLFLIKIAVADLSAFPIWKKLPGYLVQSILKLREVFDFWDIPLEYYLFRVFQRLKRRSLDGK